MVFNQHKYVENLFSKENMFSYILSTPGKSKHSGTTGTKRISTAPRSAAKTLRTMYKILCEKGITSDYNGVPLGSIFATYENYNDYRDKLIGKYIVETSFYYKPYNESFLIFNYPYDYKEEHIYLKVNMPDNNKAMDYYNRFKNKAHTDVIVLCGDWRESNHVFYTKVFNKDKNETEQIERHISFECDYISERQIYVLTSSKD